MTTIRVVQTYLSHKFESEKGASPRPSARRASGLDQLFSHEWSTSWAVNLLAPGQNHSNE
jgi:hypothetical protein